MATPPLNCDTVISQGIMLDRCTLYFTKAGASTQTIDLCSFSQNINDFIFNEFCIDAMSDLDIKIDSINTTQPGEILFLAIRVKYPSTELAINKYINFYYKNEKYPLGDLMILTGNPKAGFPGHGIDLDPNGSDIISPLLSLGGLKLENEQNFKVNVQVLIGY